MPRKPNSADKQKKTRASHRPVTHDVMKIHQLEPEMPAWLKKNKTAVAEWKRLIPVLAEAGILSPLYGIPLAMLCATYAQMEDCQKVLLAHGPTFRSPNGHICQRPEVSILRDAQNQYLKLCEQFGMTPKATGSMKVKTTGTNGGQKSKREQVFEEYFNTERSALAGG